MTPVRRLFVGSRVRLTAISPSDHPSIARWSEDSDYLRNIRTAGAVPESPEAVSRFAETDQNDSQRFSFAIRPTDADDIIGVAVIKDIEWPNRSGWLALGIGMAEMRGQGLGAEALSLLLDFAFDEIGLRRVSLTVMSYNERAIGLYARHGFTKEGVLRSAIERDGTCFDLLVFGLLAHERRSDIGSQSQSRS